MASSPPDGYVDIPTAWKSRDRTGNLIGVVVDYLPPTKSKGIDWIFTFTIIDSRWKEDFDVRGDGLKCRYFKSDTTKLPKIESKGDVVLLRNMKLTEWGGAPLAISTHGSVWHVFAEGDIPNLPGSKIAPRALPGTPSPSQAIVDYAIALCNDQDRFSLKNSNPIPAAKSNPPALEETKAPSRMPPVAGAQQSDLNRKFRLIKDLRVPESGALSFVDIMGEVRKVFSNDWRVELSISDYTSNPDLFKYDYIGNQYGRDGDEYGYTGTKSLAQWPGPWGQMTMDVAMWDSNAEFVQNSVKVGNYVFLRNVQIKHDSNGSRLEGALRTNKQQPTKVALSIIQPTKAESDELLKDLLKRRRDYEVKASKKGRILLKDGKRKEQRPEQDSVENKPQPKNSKRGKNRKNQKAGADEGRSEIDKSSAARLQPNAHIRTNNVPNIRRISIDDILDPSILQVKTPKGNPYQLPFRNVCYLAKIRVLDFLPNQLEDFAAPHLPSEYDMLSEKSSHSSSSSSASDVDMEMDIDAPNSDRKWEWRFALLVEDAGPRAPNAQPREPMILQVFGDDGDYLLRMEAEDLRQSSQALANVREKLFVLWGNLEERKRERAQGRERGGENDGQPIVEVGGDEGLVKEPNETENKNAPAKASTRPFECLVKEYGVKRRGMHNASPSEQWERCFRMWGTTIQM